MFWFIHKCIQRFGLGSGLRIWMQIKVLRKNLVNLAGYAGHVHLRPGTADLTTFREIFLREEYNIDWPYSINPTVIIDAGANIGYTSLFFARQFPGVTIYALEPESENFTLLQKNAAAYPAIKPIHAAVWQRDGHLKVTDQGYGLRGFMVEETADRAGTIAAISLPTLIRHYGIETIDIVKMDVEGSEKEIFSGDTSWLAITRCLIIELHDRMKPGCSEVVLQELAKYKFSKSQKGENLVCINQAFARK